MIKQTILEQIKKHPQSEITDVVKLVFQNEFGGGHLIKDEDFSLKRIISELNSTTPNTDIQLTEDIGNGIVRLNFNALTDKISAEAINKCFILSAQEIQGNINSFEMKLTKLQELCEDNMMPFSKEELIKYISKYKEMGYPAVSHSETYKNAYSPSYRIMKKEYADILELITAILKKAENGKTVVAIDGRCASGKTTLANNLKKIFGCDIIHADSFFLPFEKRTAERLNEVGGNIDYERFCDEVCNGIRSNSTFSYGIFNCSTGKIESTETAGTSQIILVEGSYSLHPKFRDIYDIKAFVSTDYETQTARIKHRNGDELLKMFVDRWIPMEERYFSQSQTEAIADIKIYT